MLPEEGAERGRPEAPPALDLKADSRARVSRPTRSRLFGLAASVGAFSLVIVIASIALLGAREAGLDGPQASSPPLLEREASREAASEPQGPLTLPRDVSALPFPQAGYLRIPRVRVRASPAVGSDVLTLIDQFRGDYRPMPVFAVAAALDAAQRLWYKISVPGRPNGRYGWVLGNNLQLGLVTQRIVIDRSERRLRYYDGDKLLLETEVAVGKAGAETPLGRFYVTAKYKAQAPILGAYALETSAYSKLSDWPGGGIVGIHGTPYPELIGQAVSSGCVRLRNEDILKLKELAPVGTELEIVA